MFVVGSLVLVISAFFGLLSFMVPEMLAEQKITPSIPLTTGIGAVFLDLAGFLSLVAALNADCGMFEVVEYKMGQTSKQYRPAFLGSRNWIWRSSWNDLKTTARTLPFQVALM